MSVLNPSFLPNSFHLANWLIKLYILKAVFHWNSCSSMANFREQNIMDVCCLRMHSFGLYHDDQWSTSLEHAAKKKTLGASKSVMWIQHCLWCTNKISQVIRLSTSTNGVGSSNLLSGYLLLYPSHFILGGGYSLIFQWTNYHKP